MTTTTETRAYVVHLSDGAIKTIERGTAKEIGADDFFLARTPLDLAALRIVLGIANDELVARRENANNLSATKYEREQYSAIADDLSDAIAKLSNLTK